VGQKKAAFAPTMSATAALLWLALLLATCIAQNTRVATSNTRDRIAPTSNQATDLAGVANTALSAGGRHELYEGQEGGVQLQPQIGGNKFTRRGDAQTAVNRKAKAFFFFFFPPLWD
jgi:hypothetical protein